MGVVGNYVDGQFLTGAELDTSFGDAASLSTTSAQTFSGPVTFSGASVAVSGSLSANNGLAVTGASTLAAVAHATSVFTSTGAYTVSSSDFNVVINKGTGAATQVNLPSSPATGRTLYVIDGKGDANQNNITIVPAAGSIDGIANYVLRDRYGAVMLVYNGSQWNAVRLCNQRGVVFASDYGVKADGSTDDTSAWTAAFTAATATGSYMVEAPVGISIVSTITLPAGVTLRGASVNNSYFGGTVTTSTGSVLKQSGASNSMVLTSFSSLTNENRGGAIRDMMMIGDGTHNIVTLANGIPYDFESCVFMGGNAGVEGNSTNVGAGYATCLIRKCTFCYNVQAGVWNVGDSRIIDCVFNGNGIGVQLDTGGSDNTIVGCKIEFNVGNGIQVDSSEDVVIASNICDSNGASNISVTNCNSCVVQGNVMRNFSDQVSMTGSQLWLAGNTEVTVNGNTTRYDGSGSTPTNAVGGGSNTSVITIGNSWRGHASGGAAVNAGVTGLTTSANLT